jgi:transposase
MMAQAIATQLRVVLGHIQVFETAIAELIAELFAAHEDAFIFESLPGAGPNLAPRLFAAFGEQRSRDGSAQELSQFVGVAPITEASGKKKWVHWRWFCPKFLRQSFVEWADYSRQYSFWAKAFYEQQKSQGKSHQAIMRALAFK